MTIRMVMTGVLPAAALLPAISAASLILAGHRSPAMRAAVHARLMPPQTARQTR